MVQCINCLDKQVGGTTFLIKNVFAKYNTCEEEQVYCFLDADVVRHMNLQIVGASIVVLRWMWNYHFQARSTQQNMESNFRFRLRITMNSYWLLFRRI